jgi:DNA-binding response OmpR family regulator
VISLKVYTLITLERSISDPPETPELGTRIASKFLGLKNMNRYCNPPSDQPTTVMVVDDDPDIQTVVGTGLKQAGFDVWTAGEAERALSLIEERGIPNLAVIDIGLPKTSGVELARSIKEFSDLPVIMLTAVTDSQTIVSSLDEFAEDYVTKPVLLPVLVARVRRVLGRIRDGSYASGPSLQIDQRLTVELSHARALVDGEVVSLTPTEAKLMHILMRDAGRTVRTEFLLGRIWPLEEVFEETLRVHVYRLRRKIEIDPKNPSYILTVRGEGYSFPAIRPAEVETATK